MKCTLVKGVHPMRREVPAPHTDREAQADVAGVHGVCRDGFGLVGIYTI